jgi:hypothetical protein
MTDIGSGTINNSVQLKILNLKLEVKISFYIKFGIVYEFETIGGKNQNFNTFASALWFVMLVEGERKNCDDDTLKM